MIAQANSELTVLVPFIDADGLSEIFSSLEQALERGVKVSFLTRELGKGGRNLTVLSSLVDAAKRNNYDLQLLEAILTDDSPISHAKVFSRDGGDEVYVGSANLTAVSLERTIEIGVFLRGEETRPVGEFLSLVKSLSRKRWP
jgi:phosphatidylserine/phosphatidylglycerophosphate/cardiolipin synthase-like enzyme